MSEDESIFRSFTALVAVPVETLGTTRGVLSHAFRRAATRIAVDGSFVV